MSVLETLDFQPMLITDVFETITASKAWYDKNKIQTGHGAYPYVSRSKLANGHESVVGKQDLPPNAGNAITIGVDTQSVFYQPTPFYTSVKIQVLRHVRMTPASGLVLVSLLREQMMKFQWGNGVSLVRLQATRIMVPAITKSDGTFEVDWAGMDRFGSELLGHIITRTHGARETHLTDDDTLPDLKFKPMLITDIFDSMKASNAWYDRVHLKAGSGKNLYLSQTQGNNSVVDVVADQDKECEPGNCITVTLKTQATFYQPVSFYTAQNFLIFRHELMNEYNGLFLTTAMRQAMDKFSWGYGVSMARLKKTRIMVPVIMEASGEEKIDWDGMTAYGRALRARAEQSLNLALGDRKSVV